ncbi:pol II transcription elongation factor [Mycena maculata]|uniref:Elongator complex protein 1 n=1 Tax=Mycena maculata TaxID=230809 RepID=A0AAD7IVK4_9AGAR|nr:pol II transcription elongation factor [Mycena maculata]
MRNLSLTAEVITDLPDPNVSRTAIDLDENVLYATSERENSDGEVEVKIWKIAQADEVGTSTVDPPTILTMFTTNTLSASNTTAPEVVSFRFLPDSRQLAVLMRGGDITMINVDDEEPVPEVEGTMEAGILVASWSPDDSLLAIVTGEQKLTLMTSTFDVLSDVPLFTTDFGEDAPINVGWGSKQTQFHGSLGKVAAQAPSVRTVGASPDDDTLPRVSWRGDGAFFVVSSLSPASDSLRHRTLRVYDRQAALQSTSEAVPGLEHAMVWRPSGNLIVGTQRFGFEGGGAGKEGRHDVVFFERNGLRHGEFGIRVADLSIQPGAREEGRKWGYKVKALSWSSDSNVLGLWIEKDEGDIFQLWTTSNYHWYLKHEMAAPFSSSAPGRFTSAEWHPEKALHVVLTTSSKIIQRTYGWETHVSLTRPPNDSGTVAVLDGSKILLTPFRTQNVPPPMSSHQLVLSPGQPRPPIHASLSPSTDTLALLWESGHLELWALRTRLTPGPGKIMDPSRTFFASVGGGAVRQRQVVLSSAGVAQVLGTAVDGHDYLAVLRINNDVVESSKDVELPSQNGRLVPSDGEALVWQASTGRLFEGEYDTASVTEITAFPEFCFLAQGVHVTASDSLAEPSSLYIGLASSGKLFVTAPSTPARVLASNATSFTVASGFVVFTSSAHEATFAPLGALQALLIPNDNGDLADIPSIWDKRRVERGSRIVVAVPSAMSLVLQMPRGNLETINPRPLVMEVVRQDLDARDYRKAFLSCRKHRIDLNALVEHDHTAFLKNLPLFVEQVHEVDHINLFLTGVGQGSQSPETIAEICNSIRAELERKDLTKYVNSILTAYMVKTPPDPEAGLALLLRLRESNPHLVEDAVRYIIFLVDADRLFDTALGMYDFSLVLMIAQHAQKDPREYLPFLRELRALDKYYQRFRIDDHLKRHDGALRNLNLAGSSYFAEAVAYIEQHRLYELAISIWKGTEQYNNILDIYGDWLYERRDFRQAASGKLASACAVFIQAGVLPKAMAAHEKALDWQELFDLAVRTSVTQEDVVAMGYRVAEDLASKKRYSDAARVLLDYAKDVREAVITLVQGNCFSEACRIATLTDFQALLTDVIHPGALESRAQISEDIGEMREQLRKQLQRIRQLRVKKAAEPDAFYGMDEDTNLHNVDVMTDVSMPATAFTRYTVAPTSMSKSSKRTSRSKRKIERNAGRKGTADEEEYLLKSITKLVVRFNATQGDARQLLPHLIQFAPEHVAEASALQVELAEFEQEFVDAVEEIWKKSVASEEEPEMQDSWALRMEEKAKQRLVDPLERVVKPDPKGSEEWRMKCM